jgi:hypothetical protein
MPQRPHEIGESLCFSCYEPPIAVMTDRMSLFRLISVN